MTGRAKKKKNAIWSHGLNKELLQRHIRNMFKSMRCINYRHLIVDKNTHDHKTETAYLQHWYTRLSSVAIFLSNQKRAVQTISKIRHSCAEKADVNERNSEDLLFTK